MKFSSCGCRRRSLGVNNGWVLGVFLLFLMMNYLHRVTQSTVDKLIKKTNLALVVGTNSWRDQFMEAITVSAGTVGAALPADGGGGCFKVVVFLSIFISSFYFIFLLYI